MKKILTILIAAVLAAAAFACGAPKEGVTVYTPDGATALSLVGVMQDGNVGGKDVSVEIMTDPSIISTKLLNDEADLAILPANAAANVYNKSRKVKLVTVNTYGLLYLVGKDSVSYSGLSDLVGKVVYLIGEGNVPDLVFRYILDEAELACESSETAVAGKVALSYVSTGATLVQKLKDGSAQIGVLGEPAASNAYSKVSGLRELADVQELFQTASGSEEAGYPQSCLVVRTAFLEQNEAFVEAFVESVEKNLTSLPALLKESSGAADVNKLVTERNGTEMAGLSPEVVLRMNLCAIRARDVRSALETFLGCFPLKQIGGALPDDGFYYVKK